LPLGAEQTSRPPRATVGDQAGDQAGDQGDRKARVRALTPESDATRTSTKRSPSQVLQGGHGRAIKIALRAP
jgi:hypothetical protein